MDTDTLRMGFAARLKATPCSSLAILGDVVSSEACWGALVESLEHWCCEDADYLVLLDMLVELRETRALMLFVSAVRTRPTVLEVLVTRAPELPRAVQCALVTLRECEALLDRLPVEACAAAHELVQDPKARAKSEAVYASYIGSLRSMKWGRPAESAT